MNIPYKSLFTLGIKEFTNFNCSIHTKVSTGVTNSGNNEGVSVSTPDEYYM